MKLARLFLLVALAWLVGCTTADVTPDTLMIGQGVADGAAGTYLYVSWQIPQP